MVVRNWVVLVKKGFVGAVLWIEKGWVMESTASNLRLRQGFFGARDLLL